jgi:hypothetical protein
MPGTGFDNDNDFDDQDQSETFDEDMLLGDDDAPGDERRTFEELPSVEDLTQAVGDRDDDEALALDADEFDLEAVGDEDAEADDELNYRAVDEEREDDLDGLGPEDGFDEARISASEIDGQDEVRDAAEAEGGEDDFSNFSSKTLGDDALREMGYSDKPSG